jgi:hypothetical protein
MLQNQQALQDRCAKPIRTVANGFFDQTSIVIFS